MYSIVIPFLIISTLFAKDTWEESIDSQDGMSYIRIAEDLSADGIRSTVQRKLITELYVFAAVAEPMYRDSAIRGIISIETDENLILQLQNLLYSKPLLVPSIVNIGRNLTTQNEEVIESVCDTLTLIRQGKTITAEQADFIKPWSFMLPESFGIFFQESQRRKKTLTSEEIRSTLKVELAVLGGSSLWSADMATTGGNPVVISMSADLATLLSVDPTKRVRKNGRWSSSSTD